MKRLGKNSKPFFLDEMSNRFYGEHITDFSSKIVADSTLEDVNLLEVYSLKEKLRVRDPKSTLPDSEDFAFLRDLGLIKTDGEIEKLTVAGLLFVGKQSSISRLLPSAEVIYLHYSADNLEEYDARLDMRQPIVSVLDRLTEIIQNDNRILNVQIGLFRLEIADFSEKVFQEALLNAMSHRDYQSMSAVYVKHYLEDTRKCCLNLVKLGLIETVGKEYMLTARVYEMVKSDVQYTRDKVVQYIKAKQMIVDYLETNGTITNVSIQELCGFTKQQARATIDKMRKENIIDMIGKGKSSKYVLVKS